MKTALQLLDANRKMNDCLLNLADDLVNLGFGREDHQMEEIANALEMTMDEFMEGRE